MRFSVRHGLQNALFRRVRLSSPGQTSSRLTQKRILCVGPHGKVQSAPSTSRKSAFCARAVAQSAPFREVRPQAEVRGPRHNPPAFWRAVALRPPPGDDVNEKAQSACWASRKSALCAHRLTERRSLSPPLPQNASFREIVPPECAFPYGTGCRMRFSVECAFPHLGKRRAASRKSAACTLGLTEKCSLHPAPHGKVQSVREQSRRVRLSVRSDPKPKFGGSAQPPRSLAGGCSGAFAQLGHFP